MKILVFDMDGTIADLYGVTDWLKSLQNNDPSPYYNANPLYNMDVLTDLLDALKSLGWRIVVTTWLAKGSNAKYDKMVREAKLAWLDKYYFPYDEIHMVKYGTTKANCTRKHGGFQILVDDNDNVRGGWTLGATIDAKENILEALSKILTTELDSL